MRRRVAFQKHFVRNSHESLFPFRDAFGLHTRPRVALRPTAGRLCQAPNQKLAFHRNALQSNTIMTADELRALQAPLKAQYRERSETALITLHAKGRIGENVTVKIETGKARVETGLHPATGGDGNGACSADMLLEALVGCAGVTLSAVATALNVPLRNAIIRAEGDLDFRGTLGVSKDVPVGFKKIRLNFDLDTDANEEQVVTLIRLTERYCVVYQTLSHPANIAVSHQVISG